MNKQTQRGPLEVRLSGQLGPLPAPAGLLAYEDGSGFVDCYTADQMMRFAAEKVAAERERCARLADGYASDGTVAWQQHFAWCAADIRRGPENDWRAKPFEALPARQGNDG
jgi:hypothetical protein